MEDWAVLQVILKEKVELRCYGSNERKNICIYDGGSSILVDILLKFQVLDLFMTLVPCIWVLLQMKSIYFASSYGKLPEFAKKPFGSPNFHFSGNCYH